MSKAYEFPRWEDLRKYVVSRLTTNTHKETCIARGAYYINQKLFEHEHVRITVDTPVELFMLNFPSDRRWVCVQIICKAVPIGEDHVAYYTTIFNENEADSMIVEMEDILGQIL